MSEKRFVITKEDRWGRYYWVYTTFDTVAWANTESGATKMFRMKAETEAGYLRERHRENVTVEEVGS